jgi:ABC-type molybdate transport system substrate-binding protein
LLPGEVRAGTKRLPTGSSPWGFERVATVDEIKGIARVKFHAGKVDEYERLSAEAMVALFFVFAHVTAASAAEVNVLSARAIATVLNEIGSEFEQTSGHKLNVMSGLPSEFIKHIDGGVPVDLVVSGSAPVDRLVQDGKLVAGTRTDLVRSGIGVGVRAGAPKPDSSVHS